jgi:hypothetical protein
MPRQNPPNAVPGADIPLRSPFIDRAGNSASIGSSGFAHFASGAECKGHSISSFGERRTALRHAVNLFTIGG